jgi:glucose-6-phosphate 1-dehydrogenase
MESDRSPCAIVILGASGDLARRKLIPALNILFSRNQLDPGSIVIGSGRSDFTSESFRSRFTMAPEFASRLLYHKGISGLKAFIASQGEFKRIVIFMALPPHTYGTTAAALAAEGFGTESALVVEKPFGFDQKSACDLDTELHRYFTESRIFRIDHYLAKEAVQNILVFRFANSLFEPLWETRFIESIQISACEEAGVAERAAYFDHAGIVRDMMQNHLMQLASLLTMETPADLEAESIRAAKLALLRSVRIERCAVAQYRGFTGEKGIAPDSTTPTFCEMALRIDTPRWSDTPVFMRAGKALNRSGTEIAVTFRSLPRTLFNSQGGLAPNRIIFKIQPAEGIILDVSSKSPGSEMRLGNTAMKFCYRDAFKGEIPEAYQRLLADVVAGDHTLFVSAKEATCSWSIFGPWLDRKSDLFYERGALPPSPLEIAWVDFSRYGPLCA